MPDFDIYYIVGTGSFPLWALCDYLVLIAGKLANEFTKYHREDVLMEILIASAVIGGLAVRLGFNRWWTWLVLAAGLGAATYSFINFYQYLPKSSFLLAAICAGLGAILPDLGVAFRDFLRRPRTISVLLVIVSLGAIAWYAGSVHLQPSQSEKIGQTIGSAIIIAIMAYGIWTMISGPFRKKKKK